MIFFKLFGAFFKIGLFTFGGGYAMIPMIQQDVLRHAWMTQKELIDFIAVSESTPGPFAINISTFVGMSQGGLMGAFFATLGVLLPSFLIILLIARFFTKFSKYPMVNAALYGLRPAVIGLVSAAALSVFLTSFIGVSDPGRLFYFQAFPPVSLRTLIIVLLLLIVSRVWKKLHPIWLILLSGCLGIGFHLLFPGMS